MWSLVDPYFINFEPTAFVATFPPIELEDEEAKEIGNNRLCSTKFFTLSVIAPAWQITWSFSNPIHIIHLSSDTTISLFAAVAPPHKPVLPPEITNF